MSQLFEQISKYIQSLIVKNQLGPDSKLPSERELVDRFCSTRITVRQALLRLQSLGVVYKANRRGWYLAPKRFVINPSQKTNFNLMAIEQNRQPFTNVMALKVVHPAKEVGEALDLTTNSGSALCLIRVRGLDNRIVMSEEIYLKKSRYPNLETKDLSQSITSLLQEEYSVNVVKEHTNIQIVAVDRVVASYLEINEGESCFKIVRKRYDEANKIVDYNIEYWLHGAIEMESWAD